MKKLICISLSLLLILSLFSGCAAEKASMDYAYTSAAPMDDGLYDGELFYRNEKFEMSAEPPMDTAEPQSVADNRKLIRTLSLHAETEAYDEFLIWIETQVHLCGGYIETMEANTRHSSTTRYANLTIRVPADQLDAFAGLVGEESNIVYRSESCKDITTTYVDTQAHRDALSTEYARLLELLEQAKSLSEILQIENRLTEVRYDLQRIESQLRTYDNLVDYATITLNISEVEVYTVVEEEEKGFWEELGTQFVNSLKGTWEIITGTFSYVIVALPYLLLASILPLIGLIVYFRRKKKQMKHPAEDVNHE